MLCWQQWIRLKCFVFSNTGYEIIWWSDDTSQRKLNHNHFLWFDMTSLKSMRNAMYFLVWAMHSQDVMWHSCVHLAFKNISPESVYAAAACLLIRQRFLVLFCQHRLNGRVFLNALLGVWCWIFAGSHWGEHGRVRAYVDSTWARPQAVHASRSFARWVVCLHQQGANNMIIRITLNFHLLLLPSSSSQFIVFLLDQVLCSSLLQLGLSAFWYFIFGDYCEISWFVSWAYGCALRYQQL